MIFMIPAVKGNARLKLALNIPTGASITVVKEIIDTLLVADKQLKSCQNNQRQQFT